MKINKHFENTVGSSQENFLEFIKKNTKGALKKNVKDIDYLAQRVAINLFYFEDNIQTAKTDFISLLRLLMLKGAIFEKDKSSKNITQEKAIAFAIWLDKHNFIRTLQVYPEKTPFVIKWQRAGFPNERTYTNKQLYKKFEDEQNI